MYTEAWLLHTHPNTPQGSRRIEFKGAAVAPNVQGRERRKIAGMLAEKEKQAKVCCSAMLLLLCLLSAAASGLDTLNTLTGIH